MADDLTLSRVCVLLAVLVEEIRGLRSDIAGRKQSKRSCGLSPADTAALLPLLPVVVAVTGGDNLSVHSLHAASSARTAEAQSLRRALDATGLNPLQLGRLLRRASESEMQIGVFYVHRIGPSRNGVTFSVDKKTHEHHVASGVASALRASIQA